ncbi:MAG: Gfo/Idh/MocA family oxidoreductase [Nitrososphaerales archaeon]|nr:Gfo/Idh/MocA family oxidoreductase [Nitrososphaerales archaeon]
MKAAVVGTGSWGKHHLRVLNDLGYLDSFVEMNDERRKLYEKKYSIKGFSNINDLIKDHHVDIVNICTPTITHFEIAKTTLSNGISTLVEKPLTYSSSQGEELVNLAHDNNAALTVGFVERFNPVIIDIKNNLQKQTYGDPLLIEFQRENRWAGVTKDIGVILDSSVHDIDGARWLFNEEPNVVFARTGNVLNPKASGFVGTDYEDFATIVLGFKNGKTAIIIANWVTPYKVRRISVTCTDGNLSGDYMSQEIRLDDGNSVTIPTRKHEEPLVNELTSFINAVKSNSSPVVTGIDGLNTIKIAEAAITSAKRGSPIYLDL